MHRILIGIAVGIGIALMLAPLVTHTLERNKVLYELQEKCERDAEAFVDRAKAASDGGYFLGYDQLVGETRGVGFESHYSPRFNKCFAYTSVAVEDRAPSTRELEMRREELSVRSVTDSRLIAEFLAVQFGRELPQSHHCWAVDPAHFDRTDTAPYKQCSPDDPGQGIPAPGSFYKWTEVIKPYMQD
jgi:hypothetical protein